MGYLLVSIGVVAIFAVGAGDLRRQNNERAGANTIELIVGLIGATIARGPDC